VRISALDLRLEDVTTASVSASLKITFELARRQPVNRLVVRQSLRMDLTPYVLRTII
jgi:hypothetical protein